MQNALKSDEWRRICVPKTFKIETQEADQIIQTFCKIGSHQKLGPFSLIDSNFKTLIKALLNHAECIEI